MIEASRFRVESEARPDGTLVTMTGELDLATVPQAERVVAEAREDGARHLVLDLRGLSFVDSSGLRMFILFAERARAEGWRLSLVSPPDPARTVFRLTGAEENLPFCEEVPAP